MLSVIDLKQSSEHFALPTNQPLSNSEKQTYCHFHAFQDYQFPSLHGMQSKSHFSPGVIFCIMFK